MAGAGCWAGPKRRICRDSDEGCGTATRARDCSHRPCLEKSLITFLDPRLKSFGNGRLLPGADRPVGWLWISFVRTSALVLLPAGGERFRRNEVSRSRRAVGNLLGRDAFHPFQKERFANGADYFQKSFFGRAGGLKRLAFSNGWSLDMHREYLHPWHRGHKFALKWPSRFLNTTE